MRGLVLKKADPSMRALMQDDLPEMNLIRRSPPTRSALGHFCELKLLDEQFYR